MTLTKESNSRLSSQRNQASRNAPNESGPYDAVTLIYKDEKEKRYPDPHSHASNEVSQRQTVVSTLDTVEAFVRRFVVLPESAYIAVVLWVTHTWLVEAAEVSPLLHLTSPTRQSGKTRLLEVLNMLVPKGWLTSRTTTAALIRKLDKDKPILLLDETDQIWKASSEYTSALNAILNAGHRRGQKATISTKNGKDWGVTDFEFFGPKALAGIESGLPDTIVDRSITVSMMRQSNIKAERFRPREAEVDALPIRRELTTLQSDKDVIEALREHRPDLPDELSDRQQDIWEPLLAIADWFEWGERARKAAIELSRRSPATEGDSKLALLHDLTRIFFEQKTDWLPTSEILRQLLGDDELPWKTFSRGQELTAHHLGRMLGAFNIRSVRGREDRAQLRGYRRADITRLAEIHNISVEFTDGTQ